MSGGNRAKIAAKSSVNGLAHCGKAVASRSKIRTWFWSSVTFLFACITTFELVMIVADFQRYPVLTVVDVTTKKEGANFPTVIVCSHNPVPCRNLFPVSLKYPVLWEASGCSAGMQIQAYVGDAVSEFERTRSHGENVRLRKFLQQYEGSSENPLVALWAHHNIDTPVVRRILTEPDLILLLAELRTFLDSGWSLSENFKATSSSREALRIQHHFALIHLKEAEMIASFARNEVPVLNNITMSHRRTDDDDLSREDTVGSSSNSVASALVLHFLEASSWENVSRELKAHWLQAVANGLEFEEAASKAGGKLCAGLAGYYIEKIHQPLARFPELWTIINHPATVATALRRISRNLKKILKSKSFSSKRLQALLEFSNGTVVPMAALPHSFDEFDRFFGKLQEKVSFSKSAWGTPDTHHSRFRSLFLKLPVEEQDGLLVQENELVMECSYMGAPCEITGMTSFTSTVYGKCVSFNDHAILENGRVSGPLKTNSLGQDGGLSLQLRITEDHDYTRDSVRTSGARVTILPFNGPPNVLEDGFDVPISFETNLELSARTLKRLPHPYPSDCQTHWNETDYSFRQRNYDYKACLRFCLGHEIYNTCHCVDPRSKAHQVEYKGQHFQGPWCDYSSPDSPDAICVQRIKVLKREKKGTFPCPCRPACEVLSYDIATSSTLIFSPAGSRMKLCNRQMEHGSSMYGIFGTSHQRILNPCSILKVNVYFGSFDVTETKEESKHTIFSMASDVGGALSLLLGLCGITVLETVVLFGDMVVELVQDRRKKSSLPEEASHSDKTCSRCSALMVNESL